MFKDEEIIVPVELSLGVLETWARKDPRFANITTDANLFHDAYTKFVERAKQEGILEGYIPTEETFNITARMELMIAMAQKAMEGYFSDKPEQKSLIGDSDWSVETMEKAIKKNINVAETIQTMELENEKLIQKYFGGNGSGVLQ